MNYMIHAVPSRLWYVEEFLIPSIQAQGIPRVDIRVWLDDRGRGNLYSFLDSCDSVKSERGGTWHLQDDVVISRDFVDKTATYNEGVVCGFFCSSFGNNFTPGEQPPENMWYSFPCIRIPNNLAGEFVDWFDTYACLMKMYIKQVKENKHDDFLWREFMVTKHGNLQVMNLSPNIVDHVDYLVGGTIINKARDVKSTRSSKWDDENLVKELELAIAERNKRYTKE